MRPKLRLDAEAYYDEETLRVAGLCGEALRRARQSGRLKYKPVGREVIYKGAWLIAWLDAEGDAETEEQRP